MTARGAGSAADELVPLADRLAVLQLVRVVLAATVLAAAAIEPAGPSRLAVLAAATGPYLGLTVLVELARRRARARALSLVRAMLLVDVAYLGAALVATGGPQSHLAFLVHLHVIAVTLLVSYRTGLRVALAHSVMLFAGYVVRAADLVAAPAWLAPGLAASGDLRRSAVFGSLGFWAVATATAALSSLSERDLRQRKQELRALAEMGSALEAATRPDEILRSLLAGIRAGFGFRRGAVVKRDPAGVRALAGLVGPPLEGAAGAPDAVVAEAWRTGRPVLVAALDPARDPLLHALLPWAANVVVLPMVADGEPVGALAVEVGARRRRIPARLVTVLHQFASHAALALRNAVLLAEVQRLASVDGLTGLANRRSLQDALEREVARARRSGESLAVVMVDVDHFKQVNDRQGHQVGDEVLRAVGAALTGVCRQSDLAARYGGEEFCLLLPGCRGRDAVVIAERLRAAVAAAPGPVPVTVSAGVATLPANAAGGEQLLKAADEALYGAKRAGRNRTVRSRKRRTEPLAA